MAAKVYAVSRQKALLTERNDKSLAVTRFVRPGKNQTTSDFSLKFSPFLEMNNSVLWKSCTSENVKTFNKTKIVFWSWPRADFS